MCFSLLFFPLFYLVHALTGCLHLDLFLKIYLEPRRNINVVNNLFYFSFFQLNQRCWSIKAQPQVCSLPRLLGVTKRQKSMTAFTVLPVPGHWPLLTGEELLPSCLCQVPFPLFFSSLGKFQKMKLYQK